MEYFFYFNTSDSDIPSKCNCVWNVNNNDCENENNWQPPNVPNFSDDYHIYAVYWDQYVFHVWFDNQLAWSVNNTP